MISQTQHNNIPVAVAPLHPSSEQLSPVTIDSSTDSLSGAKLAKSDYTTKLNGCSSKAGGLAMPCRRRDSCDSTMSDEDSKGKSSLLGSLKRGKRGSYLQGVGAVPHSPPFSCRPTMGRPRHIHCPPQKGDSDVSLTSTSISYSSFGSLAVSLSSTSNWQTSSNMSMMSNSSFRNEVMASVNIAQRSSSKECKAILTQLAGVNNTHDVEEEQQVEMQCALMAQLAKDSYYQVVISKYGGARILCHVMKHFGDNASIQESCCAALQCMPHAQYLKEDNTGIELLQTAMERHASSIHVQSAASQALWRLLQQQHGNGKQRLSAEQRIELLELLERASQMYLTPTGQQSVRSLTQWLLESNTNSNDSD